jgi:PAS domain S-box-containing protein
MESESDRLLSENDVQPSHRALAENLPGIVYRVHLGNRGTMQFFNDQVETLTGYRVEELTQGRICSIEPLILPDDRDRVLESVERALATIGSFEVVYRLLRKDGEVRHLMERGSVVPGPDGKPLCIDGVILDITERERAFARLHESETRFRLVAKSVTDVIWEWRIGSGELEWYGRIDELLGYGPGEFPRTIAAWESALHAEDRDRVKAALERHLAKGEPYEEEYRVVKRDGATAYWHDSGSAVRDESGEVRLMFGAVSDISERKRVDDVLRGAAQQWQATFDSLHEAMWFMDTEMRVTRANRATRSIFGLEPGQIIGRHCWEVVHGTSGPVPECPIVRAMKSRKRETKVLRIGDRSLEISGEPILDPAGRLTGIVHIVGDINEREHAAEETRALFKATRVIVEELEFANVARTVFGICRDVIGATAGFVSLLSADERRDDVVYAEPEGQAGAAALENDFGNNVLFAPMRAGGAPVGMIGLANKTGGFDNKDARLAEAFGELLAIALQRSRAAKTLTESESRYRLLAENVSDVIWTTDMEFRFTYISPSHERMSGYPVGESLGKRAGSILTPESAEVVAGALAEELQIEARGGADPKRTRHLELEQINRDGSTLWTEVNASFLRDGEGRPVGIMGVSRDVTEKRRMQASLSQADRLANMGMLAAGVAHEINNPLSYVLYNIESLAVDLPRIEEQVTRWHAELAKRFGAEAVAAALRDDEGVFQPAMFSDVKERLREALSGADRVKTIVRGLGTFSRVERTEVVPTDVRPPVEHAVNMARNEIRYRARLVTQLDITPQVLASDGKIAQVVLNLLVNAAQAIDEGGADRNEIHVRTWSERDCVFIEVRDTGRGIPRAHLDRIFEPFFTTKPVGVGSGLGLSICRKIIEDFGGEIAVTSEVGIGTTFTVRLPALAEEPEPGIRAERQASSTPPEVRGRIMVVDDEAGIRKAIARMLGRKHEVITASSGEEAQAILGKDQAFDVLFFDVMMPSMTGVDLHAWLVPRNPALADRVVFFTGGAFTPKANEYLTRVGNQRFEKPFDTARLQKAVVELVRKAKEGGA